jgi:hypothetical protein
MLLSFHHAPGFDETHHALDLAGWSPQATGFASSPTTSRLRAIWDALREGITAHRHYEQLTSRGIPHDTAIRQALRISHPGVKSAPCGRSPRHHHRSTRDANEL